VRDIREGHSANTVVLYIKAEGYINPAGRPRASWPMDLFRGSNTRSFRENPADDRPLGAPCKRSTPASSSAASASSRDRPSRSLQVQRLHLRLRLRGTRALRPHAQGDQGRRPRDGGNPSARSSCRSRICATASTPHPRPARSRPPAPALPRPASLQPLLSSITPAERERVNAAAQCAARRTGGRRNGGAVFPP